MYHIECLDTLTEMCAGLFADVPNSNREPTIWPGNPMPDDQTQTWIQRVRERNVVSIVFPLADQSQFYRTQPANFLANLIGHESKGSVLSLLKEKDWATGITAGLESSATGWSSFSVSVNLTESGKRESASFHNFYFGYSDKQFPDCHCSFLIISLCTQRGLGCFRIPATASSPEVA